MLFYKYFKQTIGVTIRARIISQRRFPQFSDPGCGVLNIDPVFSTPEIAENSLQESLLAPSTDPHQLSNTNNRSVFDLTYTRQLKLAELREARINIRQDRV